MADPEKASHDTTTYAPSTTTTTMHPSHSISLKPQGPPTTLDPDALALASQGYTPVLARNYTVLSVLAVGFSLTNSWFAISAALITGINSGGPVLIIYGLIGLCAISTCVGISLSELASAYPNAGGQYFWASELAGVKYARGVSYVTGWCAWAGSVFTSASVALAVASAVVGCYQLSHPDFEIQPWHVVVAYELTNFVAFFFNCHAKSLPTIAHISFYTSLISFLVILITVPASTPTHQEARFVFANFVNNTGWEANGIAFIVGLINTNYAFACLDCATHLAEEVAQPERMIPIAILGTVAIGFVTSWFYAIALFFSMNDLQQLFDTLTLVPLLELFYQALGNRAGAVVLECLVAATGVLCLVACHTWQARLGWSFARDKGIPFSSVFGAVDTRSGVPLAAHILSSCLVAILGLLYLGSYTAFNSMVTACIVLLYVSYSIPVVCLLVRGRDRIRHGPFWLGKVGLGANCVLLAWTVFTVVMYSFPPVRPVVGDNMNYVSVVYGVLFFIVVTDWAVRGRKHFRGQVTRHQEAEGKLNMT